MTQSPILSYKKPNKDQTTATATASTTPTPRTSFSPSLSSTASNTASPQLPPHTPQPRKISSRRKALQEFYHLQQSQSNQRKNNEGENGNNEQDKSTEEPDDNSVNTEVQPSSLKTAEDVEQFIKTSSTKDILKLRNKIQLQLSSSSQKKKEIIYDNYYELIKLSNMLGDLSESKRLVANIPPVQDSEKIDSLSGFKIFSQTDDSNGPEVSIDTYLEEVLNDLSNFNQSTIKKFTTGGFDDVLNRLDRSSDRAESNASMVGVYNDTTVDSIPDDVNKSDIINQISYILELPNQQLEESEKVEAESKIDKIIQSTASEALKLQLNTIKSRMY